MSCDKLDVYKELYELSNKYTVKYQEYMNKFDNNEDYFEVEKELNDMIKTLNKMKIDLEVE